MWARSLVSVVIFLTNVFAQADNLAGEYTGPQVALKLRAVTAGTYSGTLQVEGAIYPVQAKTAGANRLDGTFTADAHPFRFTASLIGSELRLRTDGTEHVLTKSGAATSSSFNSQMTGLSVALPAGWSAQDQQEGVVLLPPGARAGATTEAYFAVTNTGYDPAEEADFAKQVSASFLQGGVQVVRGGTRQPLSAGGRNGSLYAWDLRDPATAKAISFNLYIFPAGDRAYAVVAVGETERIRTYDTTLRNIAASLQHRAPQISANGPLADNTPLAQFWLQKLRGKVVKQFIGGAGTSGQRIRHLAADGTYTYSSNVAIVADVPGVSASSLGRHAGAGRWRILDRNGQAFLQLMANDGDTQTLSLTVEGRQWYLDGDKAFAVDPE